MKKAIARLHETEREKLKAYSDLIAALTKYRALARKAGRKRLAKWADRTIAQVAGYLHVHEDLALQSAIAAFHYSGSASVAFDEDLLRGFRKTLTTHEFNALLDVTGC